MQHEKKKKTTVEPQAIIIHVGKPKLLSLPERNKPTIIVHFPI
jgi:hypothetical protein